jgi:hypothetical protein
MSNTKLDDLISRMSPQDLDQLIEPEDTQERSLKKDIELEAVHDGKSIVVQFSVHMSHRISSNKHWSRFIYSVTCFEYKNFAKLLPVDRIVLHINRTKDNADYTLSTQNQSGILEWLTLSGKSAGRSLLEGTVTVKGIVWELPQLIQSQEWTGSTKKDGEVDELENRESAHNV